MKNLLLLIFMLIATGTFAQVYVDKINLTDRKVQYIEVWEKFNKETNRFLGMVDFGQQDDWDDRSGSKLRITNAGGQEMEFNGIINILNFLHANGFELVNVKTIDNYDSYLMKRKVNRSGNLEKNTANKNLRPGGS